jgi:hypothetical protein
MSTRIRLRRDTAANWTSNNPTLTTGEMGYETDTGKFKIGNNTNAWTALPYSISAELSEGNLNDLKDVTITSAASGDFLRWNGTAWINDAVNLSTDTIGSYVESLVAGTGITLTNNSGEGATPTVAVTTNTFDAYGAASTAATNAATALSNHEADTTSIHGIADTSILVTTTGSQTLTNKTITSPSGLVKGDVGLGNVDNTADTAKPVSTAQQTALDLKANLASPTFTGTVSGISATMVGLGSVNNTADTAKPVSTAQQTALDLKANLASPTFTGTVTIPSGASISGFAPLASPTFTGTATANDLTVSGNLTVSGTTTSINTETLTVDDNIIVLNNNATGGPTQNAGIEIERGSSANVALRWNETSDKWELTTDGSAYADIATETYAASLTPDTLNDIGDVTITSASSGQFLKWNGTAWVNDAVPIISNIDDITGVTITAAADKDFLMYNGTAWVDQPITLGTDTTGSYVTSLVAGTGVTLTNNSGESATPTVAVNTTVIAPLASPTFTGTVTIPSGASISGYALTTAVRDSLIQLYMEVI